VIELARPSNSPGWVRNLDAQARLRAEQASGKRTAGVRAGVQATTDAGGASVVTTGATAAFAQD
jgi:hypothetical protein